MPTLCSAETVETDVTEESKVIRLFDRAMAPDASRLPADLVVYNAGNNQIAGERLLSRAPQLATERGVDGLLGIDAIAEAYWQIHRQQRSAWSHEIDLRPYKKSF